MVRRFSLWCTGLILLTALASLGIAGCGGGSGGSGVSSQDLFGNLTVRVTREEGPTRVQVQGETILLATSSSAQRLLVELFPLPLQSPPTPLMARSFDLVDGRGQVVIDQIPAPARYQVRGYLYEGANAEYSASFLVEDIEILPGVVASASTWLTPRPSVSPTVSPSPSPSVSPSPGAYLFVVGTGQEPHVAMRADGQFLVSWQAGTVQALGFNGSPTPAPLWPQSVVVSDEADCKSPVPAINSSGLFGVAWIANVSTSGWLQATYRNLDTGSLAGGPKTVFVDTANQGLGRVGFGMCGDSGDPPPTPVVDCLQGQTLGNSIQSFFVPAPDPADSSSRETYSTSSTISVPNLDVDVNGDCAQVYHDSSLHLQLRVSRNDAASTPGIMVGGAGASSVVRPSVAIRNGRVAVAWLEVVEDVMTIFIQRFQYTPGSTILTPVPLDSTPIAVSQGLSGLSHTDPDVAMDGEGNCVVVWRYWEGESHARIVGRPVNSDGSLQPVFQASIDSLVEHEWPSVGMDSAGNYVVCWGVQDGGPIYGRRYPSSFAPGVGI
jgi:hypothetical protein